MSPRVDRLGAVVAADAGEPAVADATSADDLARENVQDRPFFRTRSGGRPAPAASDQFFNRSVSFIVLALPHPKDRCSSSPLTPGLSFSMVASEVYYR